MADPILIYGAYGYTGELIARFAKEQGIAPILAGRSGRKLLPLAEELGFEHRVFQLDDPHIIRRNIGDVKAVVHCAGPFLHTFEAVSQACMDEGVHYLDITGEAAVFEALAARHHLAQEAGIALLPGAGFDVVPTDCMAAYLAQRLPSATHLALAIYTRGGISRGTGYTMVENLHRGGLVRRDGKLTPVPTAYRQRDIDFGRGDRTCLTIPWGDVSTAYHSTGIPNIEVYAAMGSKQRLAAKLTRWFRPLMGTSIVQGYLLGKVRTGPAGPTDEQRTRGSAHVWGEARDEEGNIVSARLHTAEGYTLTALTALEAARRFVETPPEPGFYTPSKAFGADFILDFEDSRREDLD
ncbi:MAG: saccharopine dehydrogenase NADP-binding domain-containing protein [Acidobacteriota bacterium]